MREVSAAAAAAVPGVDQAAGPCAADAEPGREAHSPVRRAVDRLGPNGRWNQEYLSSLRPQDHGRRTARRARRAADVHPPATRPHRGWWAKEAVPHPRLLLPPVQAVRRGRRRHDLLGAGGEASLRSPLPGQRKLAGGTSSRALRKAIKKAKVPDDLVDEVRIQLVEPYLAAHLGATSARLRSSAPVVEDSGSRNGHLAQRGRCLRLAHRGVGRAPTPGARRAPTTPSRPSRHPRRGIRVSVQRPRRRPSSRGTTSTSTKARSPWACGHAQRGTTRRPTGTRVQPRPGRVLLDHGRDAVRREPRHQPGSGRQSRHVDRRQLRRAQRPGAPGHRVQSGRRPDLGRPIPDPTPSPTPRSTSPTTQCGWSAITSPDSRARNRRTTSTRAR